MKYITDGTRNITCHECVLAQTMSRAITGHGVEQDGESGEIGCGKVGAVAVLCDERADKACKTIT